MNKIGFRAETEDGKEAECCECAGPCAIEFDSGRKIALKDLTTHCMISGATGTGKTTGPASEIVRNSIHAGLPMVIMDVKCNLGDRVRGFATECGRETAIIEFGSYPSATPINILAAMDAHDLHEFFLMMLNSVITEQHNRSFHLKGVRYAADCGRFMQYLAKVDPIFTPTVARVAEMIASPDGASKLFRLWKEKYINQDDADQAAFVSACGCDQFHPLNRPQSRLPGSSYVSATISEQYSYANHALGSALGPLLRSPGFRENFCEHTAPAPDFKAAYREDRIVHIRFEPSCGQSGAILSRLLLSEAYKSLYEIGLELKKQVIFFCDEFQAFCDLSGSRFSDSGFVERAREYGGSLVACTQSASGLAARFGATATASFYNNLNNLIFLYSTDPLSCSIARQHDPDIELPSLKFGQCFVKSLSLERKAHETGTESVNQAWERCQGIAPVPASPRDKGDPEPSFASLCARFEQMAEDKPALNAGQKKDEAQPKRMTYQKEREPLPPDEFCASLIKDFPNLFAPDARGPFAVPIGWRTYVRRVFELAGAMDVPDAIVAIFPGCRGYLELNRFRGQAVILEALLRHTGSLCMICGGESATELGVCAECLEKHGIYLEKNASAPDDVEEDIYDLIESSN